MKLVWLTAVLAAAALAAPSSDISGSWKVLYAGPLGTAPKTIGSMILDLGVSGNAVTGMVRIGVWPGDAPIADGKIDDDRVTFTATGSLDSSSGIPTCRFEVTVHGDEMFVTMTVINNPGGPLSDKRIYEFKGQKTSTAAPAASVADVSGTWNLLYTGPAASGFKTLGSIVLHLKVNGNAVTGVAHLASWPGDAPIADGKMEGDRITFTATGTHTSTTGIPTCKFELTMHGDEMVAVMSVIRNSFIPPGTRLEFKGPKTSD